jgi:hypothetical protein
MYFTSLCIKLDEGQASTKKKSRAGFSTEEDILLVQTWLNVSKDSNVGTDQKGYCFWSRIKDRYNNYHDQLLKKETGQLKARYHRLNGRIQKFVGCYKAAVSQNKSGRSESYIMIEAHKIYEQDEKRKFLEEHAWRLLKDEPKWKVDVIENCSKRTKVSNSGGYTTSSNPGTPIDCSDYDQATPASRPMGQKMAKRKSKGKSVATPFDVDLTVMESALSERNVVMLRVADVREKEANARELEAKAREAEAKAREEETEAKWYDILFKDTSTMNETQLRDHEFYCNRIRKKLGMI